MNAERSASQDFYGVAIQPLAKRDMRSFRPWVVTLAGLLALSVTISAETKPPSPAISTAAVSCESLSHLALHRTAITLAQSVAQGAFTGVPFRENPPAVKNLPAFCRVAAAIKPAKDSDIKIEVWMPASGWNGRFLGVGNGGWAGQINYPGLMQGITQGFATASTDTGHTGNGGDASFALGHPAKLIDLGYRSVHEMTIAAKAIAAAFYGRAPRFSYWNGCSTGGKQGLTEAQRFPSDYNGISEGNPANYWTHLMFGTIWPAEVTLSDSASYIPPSKYPLLHKGALDACDALDGVVDGIISDPTRCHFDPKVLECKSAETASCLTAPQVEAARKIYAGPKDPRTGRQIFPGLEPGSELGWGAEAGGPEPMRIPLSYFQYVLFKNPTWDFRSLNFGRDVAVADRLDRGTLNAINPHLQAFKARGGKLLMVHGWSDPLIAPLNSVNYYQSVVATMGGAPETRDFARLFMVPGMMHCGGGPGPDAFDRLDVLEQWVERGVAPDQIVARHLTNGQTDMTRPLCPYPGIARWKGSGSTNDAANFVCVNEENP